MVVLNNTKEANKQKIKEAYETGKGIWFTITDEIASALLWDYTNEYININTLIPEQEEETWWY